MTSLRASTLAHVAVLAGCLAVAPAAAQDTTYIGGTGGPDNRNVIVNMDVIDGGGGGAATIGHGGAAGTRPGSQEKPPYGELVEGPGGAVLRYPPKDRPHSRLTMSPEEATTVAEGKRPPQLRLPERSPRRVEREPARPAEKPEPETTRTAQETIGSTTPPAPGQRPERAPRTATTTASRGDSSAAARTSRTERQPARPEAKPGVPEAPEVAGGPSEGEDRTAPATGTQTARVPEPPPSESDRSTPRQQPESAGAEDATAPTVSEPARKPEPESENAREAGETQTAALPPAAKGLPERLRLPFDAESASLTGDARERLNALAERMKASPQARVQLMAYAEGTEETASRARRLSLSRALAVRSFLIDQGIRSTRMDVRALGNTADSGPLNRVDIVPAKR